MRKRTAAPDKLVRRYQKTSVTKTKKKNECIPLATGLRVEAKPLTCWVSLNKQTSLKSGEDPTESNMSFMSSASSHCQMKQVNVHYYHTFSCYFTRFSLCNPL